MAFMVELMVVVVVAAAAVMMMMMMMLLLLVMMMMMMMMMMLLHLLLFLLLLSTSTTMLSIQLKCQQEQQDSNDDSLTNDLPLFREEVPESLKEILATQRGEQLALDHFHELVHRLRGEAQKASWVRAERTKRLEVLRNNKKYVDDQLAKKFDMSAIPVYEQLEKDIEGQTRMFARQKHYNLQLQRLLHRVRFEHEQTQKLVLGKEEELQAVFEDMAILVRILDEAQMEAAHAFKQLDKVHELNVKQCENIRTGEDTLLAGAGL
eukprot:765107-Hanusia_phi.AAC.3